MNSNTLAVTRAPLTATATFSFYVGTRDIALIRDCASLADAITIKGPDGPKTVARLRKQGGLDVPVLFDGEGWRDDDRPPLIPGEWIGRQRDVGADQVLTPGRLVKWNEESPGEALRAAAREISVAEKHGADALLAIDIRWFQHEPALLMDELMGSDCGLAVVLADPGDPLRRPEAVQGLVALANAIPRLRVLRADHGALGAVAHGAAHAAIGLSTTNRHATTRDRPPSRKPDRSPRVFSLTFADWYAASIIAGWVLVDDKLLACSLECCQGQTLDRFLDEDNWGDARRHNMTSLKCLADYVLDAPREERRQVFTDYCSRAADRCVDAGDRGPAKPNPQLNNWLLA